MSDIDREQGEQTRLQETPLNFTSALQLGEPDQASHCQCTVAGTIMACCHVSARTVAGTIMACCHMSMTRKTQAKPYNAYCS